MWLSESEDETGRGPRPGDAIGRFRVVRVLGRGGVGVVVEAFDPDLTRSVALKLLLTEVAAGADHSLLVEARAAARLAHPNVVTVHDTGVHEGRPFVVMERVLGPDLAEWVKSEPRGWSEALHLLLGAARGLAAAHADGLVHRDIKPRNILVDGDQGRITDFGIARTVAELRSDSHSSASMSGTPAYMAPEQREGRSVDARADQFAFGITALRILSRTSKPPRWVRRVFERASSRAPEDRFSSMSALIAAAERRRRPAMPWVGAAALAGLGALVGGSGLSWSPCAPPELLESGSEVVQMRLGEAGVRGALVGERLSARLAAFRASWAARWRSSCEAAGPSESDAEGRQACLEQQRHRVEGLFSALRSAPDGHELVERAQLAVDALPALDDCLGDALERASIPSHAKQRARIETIGVRLGTALGKLSAGASASVVSELRVLVAESAEVDHPELRARVEVALGRALLQSGDFEAALERHRSAANRAMRVRSDRVAAQALLGQTRALARLERPSEALAVLDGMEGLLVRGGEVPSTSPEVLGIRGCLLRQLGRYPESRELLAQAVASSHASHRPRAQVELARTLEMLGRREEAEEVLLEARTAYETRWPEGHPLIADIEIELGKLAQTREQLKEALAHYEAGLALRRRVLEADHPDVAIALHRVGSASARLGQLARGREALEQSVELMAGRLGPDNARLVGPLNERGLLEWSEGNYAVALRYHYRALRIAEERLGALHPGVGVTLQFIGGAHLEQGRFEEARSAMGRAVEIAQAAGQPDDSRTAYPLFGLGWAEAELAEGPEDVGRARHLLTRASNALSRSAAPVERAMLEAAIALAEHRIGRTRAAARRLGRALQGGGEDYRWRLLDRTAARWASEHALVAARPRSRNARGENAHADARRR